MVATFASSPGILGAREPGRRAEPERWASSGGTRWPFLARPHMAGPVFSGGLLHVWRVSKIGSCPGLRFSTTCASPQATDLSGKSDTAAPATTVPRAEKKNACVALFPISDPELIHRVKWNTGGETAGPCICSQCLKSAYFLRAHRSGLERAHVSPLLPDSTDLNQQRDARKCLLSCCRWTI